jgi:hypothetical protein
LCVEQRPYVPVCRQVWWRRSRWYLIVVLDGGGDSSPRLALNRTGFENSTHQEVFRWEYSDEPTKRKSVNEISREYLVRVSSDCLHDVSAS